MLQLGGASMTLPDKWLTEFARALRDAAITDVGDGMQLLSLGLPR